MSKTLLLAAALAAGAAAAHADTLGVAMVVVDEPFSVTMLDGVKEAAAAAGAKIQVEVAEGDVARQISQVENFIASGVDAIVVNPVDTDATPRITQIATAAGVPLVYMNRQPTEPKLPVGIGYVGSDELVSGTLQMEEVCKRLDGKGDIVVMIGDLANQGARQRTQDIKDVIARPECSGIKILAEQSANWRRTEAMDLMTNWLTSGLKPDAVLANNDEMAIGAIQALNAVGVPKGDVIVAGIDATQDGLQAMQAGDLAVTVFQDAKGQGAGAARYALEIAKGASKGGEAVWIPFRLVTSANMAEYLAN